MFVSRNALMRGYLFNEAGGGEGGAGGGAGGGEAPKPLTAADVAQIANSAVTAQLKRSLGTEIGNALKTINWKETLTPVITELVPKPVEPQPGSGEAKPDPRLASLESKYAELEAKNRANEERATAAETAARNDNAFNKLKAALTPHVRPEMLDITARDLFISQKRVTFDDKGQPLISVKKAPYQGGAEEDVHLTLEDGAAHWAKNEGKAFAPAPAGNGGARGAGLGPSRGVNLNRDGLPIYDGPATTDGEKIRRANEQAEALARKYPHLT